MHGDGGGFGGSHGGSHGGDGGGFGHHGTHGSTHHGTHPGGSDFTGDFTGDTSSPFGGHPGFGREGNLLDDPRVQRGLRIGGRVLGGYLVFGAIMTVVALAFIAFVIVKMANMSDDPGLGNGPVTTVTTTDGNLPSDLPGDGLPDAP